MKLFYGEKLVSKKEYLANNKNLIHHGKNLLVLSDTNFREILPGNKNKLIFLGKIYAVIKDNGKYLPVNTSTGGDLIIKKVFSKSNLNDVIPKVEGDFVGCLINFAIVLTKKIFSFLRQKME
jgi:hypothetical protein